jgi:hypothetical protein
MRKAVNQPMVARSKQQSYKALADELEAERAITFFATSLITQTTIDQVLWDVARNCISRLNFADYVVY